MLLTNEGEPETFEEVKEDAIIEWLGRKDEPDNHGASSEHVGTCKAVQDVLG